MREIGVFRKLDIPKIWSPDLFNGRVKLVGNLENQSKNGIDKSWTFQLAMIESWGCHKSIGWSWFFPMFPHYLIAVNWGPVFRHAQIDEGRLVGGFNLSLGKISHWDGGNWLEIKNGRWFNTVRSGAFNLQGFSLPLYGVTWVKTRHLRTWMVPSFHHHRLESLEASLVPKNISGYICHVCISGCPVTFILCQPSQHRFLHFCQNLRQHAG